MAEVIIIPDCHLKPMMFNLADDILDGNTEVIPVILGDLVDDFGKQFLELYDETFYRMFRFIEKYKRTFFLYGNHDLSYHIRREWLFTFGHFSRRKEDERASGKNSSFKYWLCKKD